MSNKSSDICKSPKLLTYDQINSYLTNCMVFKGEDLKKMREILIEMKLTGQNQLTLSNSLLIPLLIIYGIMIVFGGIGSFMVILIVAKNKIMRTPRNLFILNLAISDLILCSFTEPFNLLRILSGHKEWDLGETLCKLTSMLQGTNILVSTFSISAIAIDRFQIIIHPEKDPISNSGVVKLLSLMWIFAIIISLPMYFFSKVHQDRPKKCFEVTESETLKPFRYAHSYLLLVLQYVVPMVILSVTYFRICKRIKYRMVNQNCKSNEIATSVTFSQAREQRRQKETRRQKRTNILLSCLAIIFALSWLPLNIVNIVMDFRQNSFVSIKAAGETASSTPPNIRYSLNITENVTVSPSTPSIMNAKSVLSIQAICLLIVLCSACANPVLYGWLNENFKREFRNMFKSVMPFHYSQNNEINSQFIDTNNISMCVNNEKKINHKKEFKLILSDHKLNIENPKHWETGQV